MSETCYKHALNMPITTSCPQCEIEKLTADLKLLSSVVLETHEEDYWDYREEQIVNIPCQCPVCTVARTYTEDSKSE